MTDYEKAHADGVKAEYERRMADIRHLQSRLDQEEAIKSKLIEWLTAYRSDLKKTNVFHVNQGVINSIDKLLET